MRHQRRIFFIHAGGLRPAGPPIAVARGAPRSPLRSGGPRLSRGLFILCGALLLTQWGALTAQSPAKRPLTYDVYESWRSIQGTRLSDDGRLSERLLHDFNTHVFEEVIAPDAMRHW